MDLVGACKVLRGILLILAFTPTLCYGQDYEPYAERLLDPPTIPEPEVERPFPPDFGEFPILLPSPLILSGESEEQVEVESAAYGPRPWAVHAIVHYYQTKPTADVDVDIYTMSLGACYYLFSPLAVCMDVFAVGFDVEGERTRGIGWVPSLRLHFLELGRLTLYGDASLGVIYTESRFPTGGTHFNFTEAAGLGLRLRLWKDASFLISGRYYHLSNAAIFNGEDRNPGIDGFGLYVGYEIAL